MTDTVNDLRERLTPVGRSKPRKDRPDVDVRPTMQDFMRQRGALIEVAKNTEDPDLLHFLLSRTPIDVLCARCRQRIGTVWSAPIEVSDPDPGGLLDHPRAVRHDGRFTTGPDGRMMRGVDVIACDGSLAWLCDRCRTACSVPVIDVLAALAVEGVAERLPRRHLARELPRRVAHLDARPLTTLGPLEQSNE